MQPLEWIAIAVLIAALIAMGTLLLAKAELEIDVDNHLRAMRRRPSRRAL
jgi:hypothetical protein